MLSTLRILRVSSNRGAVAAFHSSCLQLKDKSDSNFKTKAIKPEKVQAEKSLLTDEQKKKRAEESAERAKKMAETRKIQLARAAEQRAKAEEKEKKKQEKLKARQEEKETKEKKKNARPGEDDD